MTPVKARPMRDPDGGLDRRFLDGDDVRRAVHQQQVDHHEGDDEAEEREPVPGLDVEVGEALASVDLLGGREAR